MAVQIAVGIKLWPWQPIAGPDFVLITRFRAALFWALDESKVCAMLMVSGAGSRWL